jgi:hypothetical protein
MAKITVVADTESQEITVDVDGQVQDNVSSASFSLYDSYERPGRKEMSVSITMREDQDNGVTKLTHLYAKDSKEGREATAKGAALHAKYRDFVVLGDSNKLKEDIFNYLYK